MQKVIFLVDMNAFFITCEMIRHPHLKGIPSAVAGDPLKRTGIILAANYEARALGVKTAMSLHEALKVCPDLQTVSPDHTYYSEMSKKVMELLSCYTPVIEQNSIDEAWLDMTGSLHLFGTPIQAAKKIMLQIQTELELNCSIGISCNKFLSKMASEMKKPLGITELFPEELESKLWTLSVSSMYGVGKKTAKVLNEISIETIGDLAVAPIDQLTQRLGRMGFILHQHANGADFEPVTPRRSEDTKSIGKSVTLAENLAELGKARRILMQLSDEVSHRARLLDKQGHTVQITVKYPDFKSITRQMQVQQTNLSNSIFKAGETLLSDIWSDSRPVRLLGITLTDFENVMEHQLSMFDRVEDTSHITRIEEREEKLQNALDLIRIKYGKNIVSRASILQDNDN